MSKWNQSFLNTWQLNSSLCLNFYVHYDILLTRKKERHKNVNIAISEFLKHFRVKLQFVVKL